MNWERNRNTTFICVCGGILVFLLFGACRESTSSQAEIFSSVINPEIDVNKIATATAIDFKILKDSTIGQMPQNRFFWVSIANKIPKDKIDLLADAIVRDVINKTSERYHSFTIHFFFEDDFKGSIENSKSVARANFLPEGGWTKVGREPIDNYTNYKLICKLVHDPGKN